MNQDKLKKDGWFLTSECLPLIESNNSNDIEDTGELLHISSQSVEVLHDPELSISTDHTKCWYDFINDVWCFDESSGAPMYRPIAWRYIKEEWQPYWSQAPEWVKYWAIDKDFIANWFDGKPSMDSGYLSFGESIQCDVAPSFNYQGDWRDSLRKRPE